MKWWYENEEEEMKLYKNEDLCIECKNEFFSKPWDHRDPTPGQLGYCIKCDNFLIKDRKMEFDKSRVYTALNADELKQGDKVIVAKTMAELKRIITGEVYCIAHIMRVNDEDCENRFCIGESNATGDITYPLAYLVERKENCGNCGDEECPDAGEDCKFLRCADWKPIPIRAEKKCGECIHRGECITSPTGCDKFVQEPSEKYRPFKDTNELCKAWYAKTQKLVTHYYGKAMEKYCIWVRVKGHTESASLITGFTGDGVYLAGQEYSFTSLFYDFEFLDGSVCGVEE